MTVEIVHRYIYVHASIIGTYKEISHNHSLIPMPSPHVRKSNGSKAFYFFAHVGKAWE